MNKFSFKQLVKNRKWLLIVMMLLIAPGAFAQGGGNGGSDTLFIAVIVVGVLAIVVLLVSIYTLQILNVVLRAEEEKRAKAAGVEPKPVVSLWQKFLKIANKRVDADKEESIIMDHNYDGIRELDNHLPPWWNYLFYLTIVFGIFYVILYHVTDTFPLQEEAYEIEMAEAAAMAEMRLAEAAASGNVFDESTVELTTDADVLAAGAKIFSVQCVACHKADAGGLIGPNLTDDYWLHGGDIKSVFKTIRDGVPGTTMISWKASMSLEDISNVANYIKSLKGTNPAGAKAPEGKLEE